MSEGTSNSLISLGDIAKPADTLIKKISKAIGNLATLVFDAQADIYTSQGIDFNALTHLDSIGLIQFDSIVNFSRVRLPKRFEVVYFGKTLVLEMPKDSDNQLDMGNALLTKTGQELAPICGSRPVDGFWDYMRNRWNQYLSKPKAEQGIASEAGSAAASPASVT